MAKKYKVMFSTGSKEDLEKMINEFYYTGDNRIIITDDMRIYSTTREEYLPPIVKVKKGRWQVVREVEE